VVVSDALADTSVFIALESGRSLNADAMPSGLAVSIITIGELRAGVLAADDLETRDRRLNTLLTALSLNPIPIDDRVAEAWARLRVTLRDSEIRLEINDSWIAATAMALGLPLVTQDADYIAVPGLEVIHV
jgi:predicted nucleic acid-binding protein